MKKYLSELLTISFLASISIGVHAGTLIYIKNTMYTNNNSSYLNFVTIDYHTPHNFIIQEKSTGEDFVLNGNFNFLVTPYINDKEIMNTVNCKQDNIDVENLKEILITVESNTNPLTKDSIVTCTVKK